MQSGRNPIHVNAMNDDMDISNRADPISGRYGFFSPTLFDLLHFQAFELYTAPHARRVIC